MFSSDLSTFSGYQSGFDQLFVSLIHFFFFIIFHYFSKKDSHQRQNELLEGISPALLELIEKIAEELLFDKGGCQLVLAALLQCAGGFS